MKHLALRACIAATVLLSSVAFAQSGTVTITASGFAALPASPPANWPPSITWPGTQSPNGTKTYTVNDADWQALLTWTATFSGTPGSSPTAAAILLLWLQNTLVAPTIKGVQQFLTPVPNVPAPITIQ